MDRRDPQAKRRKKSAAKNSRIADVARNAHLAGKRNIFAPDINGTTCIKEKKS
jgi:hypothetical protein